MGDHHKIRLYLGVISMHFWVFFKVNVQNGGILGGLLYFQIFGGGGLEIPVFLFCFVLFFFWGGGGGVYGRCWAEPTYEEKMRVPPPPGTVA